MKRFACALSIIAFAAAIAGPSYAGNQTTAPIQVSTTNRWASGMLSTAFHDANQTEFMLCEQFGQNGLLCEARAVDGTAAICTVPASSAPNPMVQALGAITPDAVLTFFYNSSGTCTQLQLTVTSANQPL